ncbi:MULTISPECIES: protein-glutamate O-methyltransferase CheR [unclassified Lentimicrobium]|uniref:CheR family methyltransferase n=1 Tax=unclassified Lentimicrobium TaxID=2677434 RepID=UPI001557E390|nr:MULTISPECIES: protein-glutamate O-methyltransferase CheR [unclassified Lentimicrobium]NPD45900.1 protein-glutamate O-methyltransferase CheR [Lentimicrobium sp. S6]NPD84245.1 protein-glutamate O-methyltransferase CheR [Lentimicrobium sp. L6]
MLNTELKKIVDFLHQEKGIDFSGYREAMLERRTQKRLLNTKCKNYHEYLNLLIQNPQELDLLIDVYTINVSSFFRNPLSFEILRKEIFPTIIEQKQEESKSNIRVWSAGCAKGEEAYSVAILLNEIQDRKKIFNSIYFIATDLDPNALKAAKQAVYTESSIEKIKHGLVKKYFHEKGNAFRLVPIIRDMVQFSSYNLLNIRQKLPPECIYGDFDIVLCRNVLIYMNEKEQHVIFEKLYRSLRPNGYLILGEAELPIVEFKHKFRRLGRHCKIFKKVPFL